MGDILFIAPFPSMAATAQTVVAQLGLNIPVLVGNNKQALVLASRFPASTIIISRGGTASDLKQLPNRTVVEITASVSDLMSTIHRLAGNGFAKIGVVTRANIVDEAVSDFQFSDTRIYMRPCQTDEEMGPVIEELARLGVRAIIGCKMATVEAEKQGLVTVFLESGPVSIRKAMNEAAKILKAQEMESIRAAQLNAIIDNISEGIIVVTANNQVSFCNRLAQKIFAHDHGSVRYKDIRGMLKYRKEEHVAEVNGTKLLVRVIPLYANNADNGGVITFHEVSSIEDSERKIRLSSYRKGLYAKKNFADLIYCSEVIRSVVDKAGKFAKANSNILIYGETGTGKEILAQSIHNYSMKKNGPFVSVNCASIPPSLMESELFGYVEGAFTGARKGGKRGLFEMAHGGTIFLDEVGELPLDIQSRLLRVLQEKEIMRIGDDRIIPVNARVICATNKDLFTLVKEGKFRQDLYYRISVLKLRLPPLRERRDDIPLLLNFYLRQYSLEQGKNMTIHPRAMKTLTEYSWPGNIRELRNIAEVLAFYDEEVISDTHVTEVLTDRFEQARTSQNIILDPHKTLKEMENDIIRQMLTWYSTDEVCLKLGLSRTSLWRKTKNVSKSK